MPDEAFEALWRMKGGPEMIGLHGLFGGSTVPADDLQQVLELTLEQFRTVMGAAEQVGLVLPRERQVAFVAFPKDSAQSARLSWCLEGREEQVKETTRRIRTSLLLRFLEAPPSIKA